MSTEEKPTVNDATAPNGVSKALMTAREQALISAGFDGDEAARRAPRMETRFRSSLEQEAIGLAKAAGVWTEPEPPADPDANLDPSGLAEKYGRRNR